MSSTTGTSAKKRKADEISVDDESTVEYVPHLPAPVWGGVLDFMPYGEVRSALLVGRHIALEAVKYVKVLNILKPSEMHLPAARRFTNIEEVRIFCLLQGLGEFDDDGDETYMLSLETAYSATPFLTGFPKLKEAFIGGRLKYRNEHDDIYTFSMHYVYSEFCSGPENHIDAFRGLVMSLGGAFKTGLLSSDVTLEGVNHYNWNLVRPCHQSGERTETHSCSWCRNVVEQFPIPHILSEFRLLGSVCFIARNYCLSEREFWAIVDGRPGGKQAIQRASEKVLCSKLYNCLRDWSSTLKTTPPDIGKRMQIENLTKLRVWVLSETSLSEIDELIDLGFDPTRIQVEYLRSKLKSHLHLVGWDHACNTWAKSTVTELSSRGFPVDSITTVEDMHMRV